MIQQMMLILDFINVVACKKICNKIVVLTSKVEVIFWKDYRAPYFIYLIILVIQNSVVKN